MKCQKTGKNQRNQPLHMFLGIYDRDSNEWNTREIGRHYFTCYSDIVKVDYLDDEEDQDAFLMFT